MEEVLALVARMLANLEAPDTRSDLGGGGAASTGNATFLVDSNSMFRWSGLPATLCRLHCCACRTCSLEMPTCCLLMCCSGKPLAVVERAPTPLC